MNKKEIEITIKQDGTLDLDQIGYEGKECSGAIDEIIKLLGKEVNNTKKVDYYKQQKVHINQRING